MLEDTGTLIKENNIFVYAARTDGQYRLDHCGYSISFLLRHGCVQPSRRQDKLYHGKEITGLWRVNRYINRIYHLADYAKEIRISHVGDILTKEYDENNKR